MIQPCRDLRYTKKSVLFAGVRITSYNVCYTKLLRHAFIALSAVKNASLAMVAPPIAEALIATAMGLFAAIPAVVAYNRFSTKVERLDNAYVNFMDEFSTILNRQLGTKGE